MNELRQKRIWVGYSQREIAELAGVSSSTVSLLERGGTPESDSRAKVEATLDELLARLAQSPLISPSSTP